MLELNELFGIVFGFEALLIFLLEFMMHQLKLFLQDIGFSNIREVDTTIIVKSFTNTQFVFAFLLTPAAFFVS